MYFLSKETELLFEVCIIISRTQHGYLEKFERVYTGWKFFRLGEKGGARYRGAIQFPEKLVPIFPISDTGRPRSGEKFPVGGGERVTGDGLASFNSLALNSIWRRFFEFPRLFPPASRRLPIFSRCEPFPSRGGKANI